MSIVVTANKHSAKLIELERLAVLANSGVLDLEWVLLEATNAGLGDERLSSFKMLVQEFYQS